MRITIIVLIAFCLGCGWGGLCDFVFNLGNLSMPVEILGGILIGFIIPLSTVKYWSKQRGNNDKR